MYSDRKAGQIAGYFLGRAGGAMPHMKLIKLMYLADRQALKDHGYTVSGDSPYSMNNGPVLSATLDHINGEVQSSEDGWDSWVSDRENHRVQLARSAPTRDDLNEISDAEIEVLAKVWADFGRMDQYELSEYTHKCCPEWNHPDGSSTRIPFDSILRAVGWTAEAAESAAALLVSQERLSKRLAAL